MKAETYSWGEQDFPEFVRQVRQNYQNPLGLWPAFAKRFFDVAAFASA